MCRRCNESSLLIGLNANVNGIKFNVRFVTGMVQGRF